MGREIQLVNDQQQRKCGRPRKHLHAVMLAGGRSGISINARIDPRLAEAIPEFVRMYRLAHNVTLTTTDMVEKAIAELFQKWDVPIRK